MAKIAVILSGCGVFDGAELHESVLSLYFLQKQGAECQCFAPDIPQLHVVNHLTGQIAEGESRNVLVESARIARGEIKPVTELDASEFDALLLPGGFGAAKNLCNFAVSGADSKVEADVLNACQAFATLSKPAAYACIAPALIPEVYGKGVALTIGNDKDTANNLIAMGAEHINANVEEVVVDSARKLVTTPAYMLASDIVEVAASIENLIGALLQMVNSEKH